MDITMIRMFFNNFLSIYYLKYKKKIYNNKIFRYLYIRRIFNNPASLFYGRQSNIFYTTS